jgi:MFS family permease
MATWILIAVTAAGYFVDIYDLLLFSIVRVKSLRELGIAEADLLWTGVLLINLQMAGLLVGGVFWGILGDRRGRLTVLFGSIVTYSLANLLNAGVMHLPGEWPLRAYAALRFIAGVGLAGELGAAVTLVSEACSRERRGLATAFVASMGIAGAVFAGWIADRYHWTEAYFIGGVMGFLLLFMRVQMAESHLFRSLEDRDGVARGRFLSLLTDERLRWRYLGAIAQGMPIWFVVGVLLTFSPEIGRELRLTGEIQAGRVIMYCYGGAVVGDFLAGVWSQVLRRRRAAIATFLSLTAVGMVIFVRFHDRTFQEFCWLAAYMGFASGYWAVLLSSTAEQFGTNIRSTVTSTVPNFIRGMVIPMSAGFLMIGRASSLLTAAVIVSSATLLLAAFCLWRSRETFGADLDFVER